MWFFSFTSVNDIVVVQIVHRLENLPYRLRSIFLSEFPVFANPIEEFPAGRKLCDDVILVLSSYQHGSLRIKRLLKTFDSNQS